VNWTNLKSNLMTTLIFQNINYNILFILPEKILFIWATKTCTSEKPSSQRVSQPIANAIKILLYDSKDKQRLQV
jgi:hypothetical protein